MKKMIQVLVAFSLIAAISFLFPACGVEEAEAAPEGQLPILKVGDTWSWSYVMSGTTYTLTETVTGSETVEGRDCYVIDMSFDPAIESVHDEVVYTVSKMTYWADKLSGLIGVKQGTDVTGGGQTFSSYEIYIYDPWIELFPLETGKMVEGSKTTTQYMGGQAGEPTVTTEKYVVEGKEQITVEAGTFSCWKIIMYDGDGNIIVTMWYSDETKTAIKMIDNAENDTMELKSYSVN
ncbi:MAG: hypothetical protein JW845_08960 [Dehalococcoidales bacterium]|nr:hypothetical protein [Dehalococcoidales bacterium]